MVNFGARLAHAWNAFSNEEANRRVANEQQYQPYYGSSTYGSAPPERLRIRGITNERSIISSIYMRLSIDVAGVVMRHIRVDENGRYIADMDSGLNNCLTVEANIDQAARMFRQDLAYTLFTEGIAAIVPVDVTANPATTGGYDIQNLRVGTVVKYFPRHVTVNAWNVTKQRREDVTLDKKFVAIVQNPLYSVMNEPNSTLQRLTRKLSLLDAVDEQSASGKLDLIIQLPYTISSDRKREQANQRRTDIEDQLKGSKYGIAYTDGTEKVTQLNRPAENNLMTQVEYLTSMLYGQLGLTAEIMNGTADEKAMLNYYNRTVEPALDAIVEAMRRTFLTKTARSQRQTIEYFRDPFKLVPLANIADIADKFTRNEILSANEIRQVLGIKPHDSPRADQLINSNINPSGLPSVPVPGEVATVDDASSIMNDSFDEIDKSIDEAFATLGVDENAP